METKIKRQLKKIAVENDIAGYSSKTRNVYRRVLDDKNNFLGDIYSICYRDELGLEGVFFVDLKTKEIFYSLRGRY